MKIAIVGSGLTGLTAGLELVKKGLEVTIFEEQAAAGGLASAITVGLETLDRFYHHMFVSDRELLELINELGLHKRLGWFEPKNAIFVEDRLYPFTTPMDLIRFKPLGLISRIRMGLLVVLSGFITDYRPFERITAKEWIIRRSGRDSYEKIWGPLLKSKFDADAHRVSGTWIWNKFKLRGSSRSKNIGREQLGYLDGGFITLVDGIIRRLAENGTKLFLDCPVNRVAKTSWGQWELNTARGDFAFDSVLFTASPEILARIGANLDAGFKKSLEQIKFKANLCLALELTESLSPYYWITIAQEGLPFVLVIEHTNLVGQRGYGSHIVYVSRYLDAADPLYSAGDDEIMQIFTEGLKTVFPHFKKETIKKATVSRARFAQPVVTLGYGYRIPPVKTPEDGLYLASMPQIYPEDRGLNYAVRLGKQAAGEILKNL